MGVPRFFYIRMFKYESHLVVLSILAEMTETLSTETTQTFLKPLQGIYAQTFNIFSRIYCVSTKVFFYNGNYCNYNHFRTPLLLLRRPNCKVQADAGSIL